MTESSLVYYLEVGYLVKFQVNKSFSIRVSQTVVSESLVICNSEVAVRVSHKNGQSYLESQNK